MITVNLTETEPILFKYSIHSEQDIIIWNEISTDNIYVQNDDFEFSGKNDFLIFEDDNIKINYTYVVSQELGLYTFYLIYDSYITPIEITVTDSLTPYIITSTNIFTSGLEDVHLQIELFDYTFYSLNGSRDDIVLYDITNNILTIESEYISMKFESNSVFVLSYVFTKDDQNHIGYIFVNLIE